jgi:THO complex subunit 3
VSLKGHTAPIYTIKFDPLGRYFATGGADSFACLWDVKELVCVRTFRRMESAVRSISFSHDGTYLAAVSEDLKIAISDVATGENLHFISCEVPMTCVAWNPMKDWLAYAGDEKEYERDRRSDGRSNNSEALSVNIRIFGYR